MSIDFILGSMAGILFTVMLGLIITESLKINFEKVKFRSTFSIAIEIFVNFSINLFILFAVIDHLKIMKLLTYLLFIVVIVLSSYVAHLLYSKKKDWVGKLLTSFCANVGTFAFLVGVFCCIEGWKEADQSLTHGSVLIGVGSFIMMFFIAFSQLTDSHQKVEAVKN